MRFVITIILLVASLNSYAAITGIEPEVVTAIELSNTDTNRIVCPYPITDYAASTEKNITYKISGNNMFVKFPITAVLKDNQIINTKYFTGNAELFLVCGEAVYTLRMTAKNKHTETVYLSDTKGALKKTNEYTHSKSTEELITEFIQSMIDNKPLPDFRITSSDEKESYRDIEITVDKVMTGGGYIVKELTLKSPNKVSLVNLELVKLKILKNVKSVGILSPTFTGETKAYVVQGAVQ